jgi:NAD(P)-dependent dehydrogenase (short-subunit alcohol dehydrogenase family)
MIVKGSTVLVTGANRGLGQAIVDALREAGAAKIYAAARRIDTVAPAERVAPIMLDITDLAQVEAAATRCGDVNILINNAGIASFTPALGAPTVENARREMETNYFGTLSMCRAFAPILKNNGGGAIVNILSVVSWFNVPMQATYCASKAAEWSLTKAIRFELRGQGTFVAGVYAGYIDTDMTADLAAAKSAPAAIATTILAGIESGTEDILADERARSVSAELRKDDRGFDANMQKLWDETQRRNALPQDAAR